MMRNLFAVLLVAVSTTLFSCNTSPYPIDEKPIVKTDSRLLGTWKITNKKDKASYALSNLTDKTYKVLITEQNSTPEEYSAYLSNVNNNMFINVEGKGEDGYKYILLRILDVDTKNNIAHAVSIADTTMGVLKNSNEVRARITARLNDPTFYEDTITFARIK